MKEKKSEAVILGMSPRLLSQIENEARLERRGSRSEMIRVLIEEALEARKEKKEE